MSSVWLPLLLFVLVPLLPVLLAPLLHHSRVALALAPWVPLSGLLLVPFEGQVLDYPWLLLGTRLGLDGTTLPLLLLAVIAWTAAGWHARITVTVEEQPRFFLFWLGSWCGNLCVFITLDAASFYAAYAMMTFAAWGLVVHQRRIADYRAGRVYLVMALLGEAMLIAGLLTVAATVGNFELTGDAPAIGNIPRGEIAAWLFLIGFAVKMGTMPLHVWLPLAHPQAPVPASAVLSGVMLTAGLAGWLRFLPFGETGFVTLGDALLLFGLLSALAGAMFGLCQKSAKVILAYSSISQMGLVAAIAGLALRSPEQSDTLIALAVLFAVHHGLAKTALFMGVDLARQAPQLARLLLWLPCASLAGLPLTAGALVKTAWKRELSADVAAWLEPLLVVSTIATTLLLIRFLWRVWPVATVSAIHARIALPWLVLLMAGLTLPWLLAGGRESGWIAASLSWTYLLASFWPVVLGVGLAWAGVVIAQQVGWRMPDLRFAHNPHWWMRACRPRWRLLAGARRGAGLADLRAYLEHRSPLPDRVLMRGLLARLDARMAAIGFVLLAWMIVLGLMFLPAAFG